MITLADFKTSAEHKRMKPDLRRLLYGLMSNGQSISPETFNAVTSCFSRSPASAKAHVVKKGSVGDHEIYFAFSDSRLAKSSADTVAKFAARMKKNPKLVAQIAGHTSVALKMEIHWQGSQTNRKPNQFELPEFTKLN
jgi:outer membrane protein OmpA-like peptidoglycan-associated protein